MDDLKSIIGKVSEQIALGNGIRRPRLRADDYNGMVEVEGKRYRVKCRWFDGREAHEVSYEAKEIK